MHWCLLAVWCHVVGACAEVHKCIVVFWLFYRAVLTVGFNNYKIRIILCTRDVMCCVNRSKCDTCHVHDRLSTQHS